MSASAKSRVTRSTASPKAPADKSAAAEARTAKVLELLDPVLRSYLETPEAAAVLHRSVRTLEAWRKRRIGPAFIRIHGKQVLYKPQDLLTFLESHRVECE